MHLCCFLVFLDGEQQSQFVRSQCCVPRSAYGFPPIRLRSGQALRGNDKYGIPQQSDIFIILKKQSQFTGGQMGVRPYVQVSYVNEWLLGAAKKQSQSKPIFRVWRPGGWICRAFLRFGRPVWWLPWDRVWLLQSCRTRRSLSVFAARF